MPPLPVPAVDGARSMPGGLSITSITPSSKGHVWELYRFDQKDQIIDEATWRRDVTDLHRVMNTMKTVWIAVQQSNEPLVRVALEIVTSGFGEGILAWPESWWPDEKKRVYLKNLVSQKLKGILQYLKPGAVLEEPEESSTDEQDPLAMVKEWEDKFHKSEQMRKFAEKLAKDAETAKTKAETRVAELEQALKRSRETLAQMDEGVSKGDKEPNAAAFVEKFQRQLAAAEEKIARLQEELVKANGLLKMKEEEAERRIAELQRQLAESQPRKREDKTQSAPAQSDQADRRIADLERLLAESQRREREAKKTQIASAHADQAKDDVVDSESHAEPDTIQPMESQDDTNRLAEMLAELQAQLAKLNHQLEDLERQNRQLRSEVNAANAATEAAKRRVELPGPPAEVEVQDRDEENSVDAKLRKRLRDIEQQIASKDEEIASLKKKLAYKNAEMKQLGEIQAELESKLHEAMDLIKSLKKQIESLKELADSKGLGNEVRDMLAQVGLDDAALKNMEVFERLYNDALRRIEKVRQLLGSASRQYAFLHKGQGSNELFKLAVVQTQACPKCGHRFVPTCTFTVDGVVFDYEQNQPEAIARAQTNLAPRKASNRCRLSQVDFPFPTDGLQPPPLHRDFNASDLQRNGQSDGGKPFSSQRPRPKSGVEGSNQCGRAPVRKSQPDIHAHASVPPDVSYQRRSTIALTGGETPGTTDQEEKPQEICRQVHADDAYHSPQRTIACVEQPLQLDSGEVAESAGRAPERPNSTVGSHGRARSVNANRPHLTNSRTAPQSREVSRGPVNSIAVESFTACGSQEQCKVRPRSGFHIRRNQSGTRMVVDTDTAARLLREQRPCSRTRPRSQCGSRPPDLRLRPCSRSDASSSSNIGIVEAEVAISAVRETNLEPGRVRSRTAVPAW